MLGGFLTLSKTREGYYSGWRCEGFSAGVENGASVRDVVEYENEVNGKEIEVSEELLEAIDRAGLWAADVVWVCKTAQEAVMRYGERSDNDEREFSEQAFGEFRGDLSEAREVLIGWQALILGHDDDGGYLILEDASQVEADCVERFLASRKMGSNSVELN